MRRVIILACSGLLALIVASQCLYTVDESRQAILLQLGKPVAGPLGPGLHFKLPFVQNVVLLDARILQYDASSAEVLTKDKKTMVVDNFAKWRIVDPLQFYRTLTTIPRAQSRLDDLVYAEVRVAIGNYSLDEVVSAKRSEIMSIVTYNVNETVKGMGIQILDVRIKRTDLPPQNEKAIFGRMRAERERQAKLYRSEGQEEAAKIKSQAEKERTVILADAGRESETLRGQGEGEATRIFAEALNQSPEFYSFLRSMDAYKKAFQENSRVIMTPSTSFMKHLK